MSTVYNDPIMLDSTGQDIVTKLDSIASLMGDGVIDDTSTATDTTWSSNKITSELVGKQDELTFDHTPKDDSLNPVYSDGIYDSIIGVYDNLELGLGWDSKNILGIANTSKEVNGITFTVNDDGTVKLNGTATSATLYALNKFTGAELKKYGVNLLMTGGKDNSTFLTLMTQDWSYTKDDKGDGVEINISELIDATEYTVIIQIANGTTLSNYVMSPMIRLVNVIDPSFKKHHDSVDVIKADKVNVIANTKLIKDTVGWSGKNKLPITAVSKTQNNVTLTVNSDGTVSVVTTSQGASADTYLRIKDIDTEDIVKVGGSYILSGCPEGGSMSKYRLYIQSYNNGGYGTTSTDYGDGVNFTIYTESENHIFVIAIVQGTIITEPIVFKPMLRDADILDDTFEPYYIPLKDSMFPRSEQAVLGAYNILDPDFNPPSFSGVDDIVTLNNGILTLNGTRASSANYAIKDRKTGAKVIYLPKGTYTFYGLGADWENGVQVGTTYNNAFVSIAQSGSANDRVTFTIDDNTPSDYKLADGSVLIGLYVKILLGTYSNKIIKPMLCLGSDPDDTYAPYAMTNKELTDAVSEIEAGKIEVSGNSATFDVPLIRANEHAYTYGLITFSGGLYHFWLKSSDESDAVVITKIIDANSSRTLSATYANGKLSLTFSATIYGGVMVFTSNV